MQVSGILDNQLITELNRRLMHDPEYKLPDGYVKVTEKAIENRYVIPDYFPLSEAQRVAIETLDGLMSELFNIHILEPMAEVREFVRAKPSMKQVAKDKIMNELTMATGKHPAPAGKPRSSRPEKTSLSIDVSLNKILKK